jgi:hypothetical protein
MLNLTTVTTSTETRREDGTEPSRATVTRYQLEGSGYVTIGASLLQITDVYGESEERREFCYYSDSGAVLDAIVDYVAATHREVVRAEANGVLQSNWSAGIQLERLRRIAGAMGLTYDAPGAAAAGLADPTQPAEATA